jgi:hypothetical protein
MALAEERIRGECFGYLLIGGGIGLLKLSPTVTISGANTGGSMDRFCRFD